jgi:hypothetical protein
MNRKRIIKLFRDFISLYYLLRGKLKSAFAVGDLYAASGESDLNTLRDASSVETRALFNNANNQSWGNSRLLNKRKMDG